MCGTCCYGKGGISLEHDEVLKISNFLDISPESFIKGYCEYRNGRISIGIGTDGYCLLYDKEKMCLIHPVKPAICALWPFFPANVRDKSNWDTIKDACPGINRNCSFEDFVKQSKE
jgi:Fe-S-cluster containining protein